MNICLSCGVENETEKGGSCPECGGAVVNVQERGDRLSGKVLAQKYVILEPLGQGGMGSVYRAKHRILGKIVAIKTLHLGLSSNNAAQKRFFSEAKHAASLEHPHNVKVFDFGCEDDGLAFIVMELVRGEPLSRLKFPLETNRALTIIGQMCGALAEAHKLDLVHRDLKPDNVMISEVDGKVFARVVDYGIAKLASSDTGVTQTGAVVGTPEYISPEQADGRKVDARSDIYSLGCMLYELVTGQPPFSAETPMALALAHLTKQPPSPRKLAKIPADLEKLILQCLEKKPNKRPRSVLEVRNRIEALLGQDPDAPAATESAKPTYIFGDDHLEPEHTGDTELITTFLLKRPSKWPPVWKVGLGLTLILTAVILFVADPLSLRSGSEQPAPPFDSPETIVAQTSSDQAADLTEHTFVEPIDSPLRADSEPTGLQVINMFLPSTWGQRFAAGPDSPNTEEIDPPTNAPVAIETAAFDEEEEGDDEEEEGDDEEEEGDDDDFESVDSANDDGAEETREERLRRLHEQLLND